LELDTLLKLNNLTRWIEPDTSRPLPLDLMENLGGNEVVVRALVNRGIGSWDRANAFLDPAAYTPADPYDLPGMAITVDRLERALKEKAKIGVWGDFDVDGQSSTSLLVGVLRELGGIVHYHIPVRARESHGVGLPALKEFLDLGIELVLSCDTGITAHDAADYLLERSIDFLITDHHTLPVQLPRAYSVVNPQQLLLDHPLRTLAGVGVAYEVARALCDRMGKPEIAEQQLDLVALGCVADIAGLQKDVRYLVQRGLSQLSDPQRIGLRALYERAELNPSRLTEEHIGFIIGPRLNAIGRLGDANPVVDFLTNTDAVSAADFAARLEGYNSERRFMTDQVLQGALSMLERDPGLLAPPVLILTHSEWPAGVIGIVASRLVDLFNKPCILLSSRPGEPARGSARSIEGINITTAIGAAAELLLGYGGHAMAAGLALDPSRLPEVRQRISEDVRRQADGLDLTPSISIDAYLKLPELSLESVLEMERLAPFGAGNPPITLAVRNVATIDIASIGKTGEHLQVIIEDEDGATRRVMFWGGVRELVPEGRFDLAFIPRTSNYRGNFEIQLEWVNARQIETPVEEIRSRPSKINILDFRLSKDPLQDLSDLGLDSNCAIWREGVQSGAPKGIQRGYLTPSGTLVVWNTPPGPKELAQAIKQVEPTTVALFAVPAAADNPQTFLVNLSGLVRHALRTRAGQVSINQLAGLSNQREVTVIQGLNWLAANGFIHILDSDGDRFTLAEGGIPKKAKIPDLEKQLKISLEETAAFRAYYLRRDPSEILSVP